MNNEEPVVLDTQNEPEVAPQGETVEQKLIRIEASKQKLYERAKKAEAEVREYKSKQLPTPEKPKLEDEIVSDVKELKQIEKKRQFGYRNNLSPEETDLLFRFSGDKDPSESLKDNDFKDLLEVRRKRAKVADAIPSGSNRSTKIEGKTFKEMNPEERSANWDKIMGK